MLSSVRPSVCQIPSLVRTGSRWLVVSVVEFHAHVTAQRRYEKSWNGTNSPWYEGYEKSKDGTRNPWYETSTVRKVHLWYETSMVRIVYGTKSLVPNQSINSLFQDKPIYEIDRTKDKIQF